MSQSKSRKKKVVTVKKSSPRKDTKSTARTKRRSQQVKAEMIFGKENYKWMAIGAGLVLIGMILMIGGAMPAPDVWEDARIYSFRRTVIAPIVILAGLGIEIYAIFKRS